MSEKTNKSPAHLNQIEALIAALKRERERLERCLVLLRSQQRFLDDASRWYFDLWHLKWEAGLEVLQLSIAQRQLLEDVLGHDIVAQQLQTVESELHRLISEERYLTFAEIEGVLETIDEIIERLQEEKGQSVKQKRSALLKTLASKTIRVCGGVALIAMDLPIQNWPTVIGGAVLILGTSLNNK